MNNNKWANRLEDIFVNDRLFNYARTADYMFLKLEEIFSYDNLPLTISKHRLEKILLRQGVATIYQYEGDLFVTDEIPAGKPNIYYEPTQVTVRHQTDDGNITLKLTDGVDCVIIKNDADSIGLEPLVGEYSVLTAQAKITVMRNLVDLRGNYIIQAKDEKAYRSALEYTEAVRRGDMSVILAEEFDEMDGLVVHNTPIANNPATQTIELFNYINSYYYGELGININNNMKREYVSEGELSKTTGIPLINHMLTTRIEGLLKVNALFDVEIGIKLSAEWDDEQEQDIIGGEDNGSEITEYRGEGSEEVSEEDSTETDKTENTETNQVEATDNTLIVDACGEEVEPIDKSELIDATNATGGVDYDESNSTTESTTGTSGDDEVQPEGSGDSTNADSGEEHDTSDELSTEREVQSENEEQVIRNSSNEQTVIKEDEEDETE